MRLCRLLRPTSASARHRSRERDRHAIIRSLEPGEEWAWCCGDRMGMLTTGGDRATVIPPSPLHRDPRSADIAALLSGSVAGFDLDPASAPAMWG
jgi:hypothetical protein